MYELSADKLLAICTCVGFCLGYFLFALVSAFDYIVEHLKSKNKSKQEFDKNER